MKDKEGIAGVIIFLLFIGGALVYNMGAESKFDEIEALESEVSQYRSALSEANTQIEDARSVAWESYDEMGEALENLTTVSP